MKKYIIGIPSYIPSDKSEIRISRLESTLSQLYNLFPTFPVVIIAQNWNENFIPRHNDNQQLIIKHYPKLGIVKARYILQKELLNYDFDYALLLDDDAIIYGDNVEAFLRPFENKENGFCFRTKNLHVKQTCYRYFPAALNLCIISKYILQGEFINLSFDPQQNIAYEDVIYPCILHNKYRNNEIRYPIGTIFTSFDTDFTNDISTWVSIANNIQESKVPPWHLRWVNTENICNYIDKYKKYPDFELENGYVIIKEDY